MDKIEFAAVAIACATIIEGVAIITGFDGAFAAGMVGIFGGIAGSVLGFSYGKVSSFLKSLNETEEEK